MKTKFNFLLVLIGIAGCGGGAKTVDVKLDLSGLSNNAAVINPSGYGYCNIGGNFDWSNGSASPTTLASLGGFKAWVIYPEGSSEFFPIGNIGFDIQAFAGASAGDDVTKAFQFPSSLNIKVIPGQNRRIVIGGVVYYHWNAQTGSPWFTNPSHECQLMTATNSTTCGGAACGFQSNAYAAPILISGASGTFNVSGSGGSAAISSLEIYDTLRTQNLTIQTSQTPAQADTFQPIGLDGFTKGQSTVLYNHASMITAVGGQRPLFLNGSTPFSWLRIKINTINNVNNNYLGFGLSDLSPFNSPNSFLPYPTPVVAGLPVNLNGSTNSSYTGGIMNLNSNASSYVVKFAKVWPLFAGRQYMISFFGVAGSGAITGNNPGSSYYMSGATPTVNGAGSLNHVVQPIGTYTFNTSIGQATCIKCDIVPAGSGVNGQCLTGTTYLAAPSSTPCSLSPGLTFTGCTVDTDDCR